jgi:hypothetical protein
VDDLVAEVTSLLERLVAELPAGTATVSAQSLRDVSAIEVNPNNPASSNFRVLADETQVYVFGFGPRSNWEFPWERRYRRGEKDVLTEIEEMSRAVIAGDCDLTRGPFWLTARIHVAEYTYKVTDLPMFPIPPFWKRHYAPYVPVPANE